MKKCKIIILLLIVTLVQCFFFYEIRHVSLTKYNIEPRKAIEEYLTETYGKSFEFWSSGFYKDKYLCVWTYRYVDEDGKMFPMYFEFERELPEGGWATTFHAEYMETGVRDYYWQAKLIDMYDDELNLYALDYSVDNGWMKFSFPVTTEVDILEVSDTISEILNTTSQNVECLSGEVMGIRVTYKSEVIYTIYADDECLKENRETLSKNIYDDIYAAWDVIRE